jgi:hypothetical protein
MTLPPKRSLGEDNNERDHEVRKGPMYSTQSPERLKQHNGPDLAEAESFSIFLASILLGR